MRWENRVFAVLLIILLLALGIRYWRYTIVTAKVQAYLAQQDSLFYHLRPQFDSLQWLLTALSENRPAIKRSININTAAKAELTNLPASDQSWQSGSLPIGIKTGFLQARRNC